MNFLALPLSFPPSCTLIDELEIQLKENSNPSLSIEGILSLPNDNIK